MVDNSEQRDIGFEKRPGEALWQAAFVENRPYRMLNMIVQELASGKVFLDDPGDFALLTEKIRAHARSLHVLCSPDASILSLGDFPNLEWLRVDLPTGVRVQVGSTPSLSRMTSNTPHIKIDDPTTIQTLSAEQWRGCLNDHLAPFTGLEKLVLNGLAVERIELSGSAAAIRHLDISQCSNLLGFEPNSALGALETLGVSFCRRFTLDEIPRHLESLRLIDTAPLPTAKPIAELRLLRHLYLGGSSRIADGDVSPILEKWDELNSVFVANSRVHHQRVPDKKLESSPVQPATPKLKFSELRNLMDAVPEGRRRLARKYPAMAEALLAALDNGRDETLV